MQFLPDVSSERMIKKADELKWLFDSSFLLFFFQFLEVILRNWQGCIQWQVTILGSGKRSDVYGDALTL